VAEPHEWKTVGVIRPKTRRFNAKDAQIERDRAAYRELRDQGYQPPHVGGCEALQRDATMDLEITMGHVFAPEEKPFAREGQERSEAMGLCKPGEISGF
jgi:hypothetical protein